MNISRKLKLLLGFIIISCPCFGQFITEWNTGGFTSITVPTTGQGYNYTATIAPLNNPSAIITTLSNVTGNATFSNLTANTSYQVKITGNFPRIYINGGSERFKLKKVTQWGNIAWTSFSKAFFNCPDLNITATDVPNLSGVTDMSQMFTYCGSLNGPANIGSWNTSNVTNMNAMFNSAVTFNQNIGNWDTGNVTNMQYMLAGTTAFNQNISNWDTGSVTDMSGMFAGATVFNQNLSAWDTSAVQNMSYMFQGATAFNGNLAGWDTSSVTNMSGMFQQATSFNQNIGSWNTVSVTNMDSMFRDAQAFNQPVGDWDVSSVTILGGMFYNAPAFNQPVGNWNTGSAEVMAHIFHGATSFNQDIGNWDVSSVWNMLSMFENATSFNQDISSWDVSAGTAMEAIFKGAISFDQNMGGWADNLNAGAVLNSFFGGIFDNCGMSVANYDATLAGFSENGPNGLNMGAAGLYYCNEGAAARANLTLPVASGGKGWTITGDTNLAASTPILASNGSNIALMATECNYNWANPANRARKMMTVTENGNAFSPSSVVINNNNVGTLPAGVTSVNNYYQKSNDGSTIRVGNRMAWITDSETYPENGGLTVRVYYSNSEYTNLILTPPPTGDIVDAGWFFSGSSTAQGVVANMSTNTYMLPGAEAIIPVATGTESGYAYAEFRITKAGTIGQYAKTTEGTLSEVLSADDFSNDADMFVYPNPASGSINVKLPEGVDADNIVITNITGQTVYKAKGSTTIDVASFPAGIYIVTVTTDKGNFSRKFVKE